MPIISRCSSEGWDAIKQETKHFFGSKGPHQATAGAFRSGKMRPNPKNLPTQDSEAPPKLLSPHVHTVLSKVSTAEKLLPSLTGSFHHPVLVPI